MQRDLCSFAKFHVDRFLGYEAIAQRVTGPADRKNHTGQAIAARCLQVGGCTAAGVQCAGAIWTLSQFDKKLNLTFLS